LGTRKKKYGNAAKKQIFSVITQLCLGVTQDIACQLFIYATSGAANTKSD